jgi:hypothetical protein
MLADHWDWLRGSNVVSRIPVVVPRGAVEVFFDDLLSPGQPVATAHWVIMTDRVSVSPAMTPDETAAGPSAPVKFDDASVTLDCLVHAGGKPPIRIIKMLGFQEMSIN